MGGSFENEERYRRKPDLVQAVRLTAEGNVPIMHADTHWIKIAVADKRLQHGLQGGWFAGHAGTLQAAYPGDWLVHHDADRRVEVVGDEAFRARFEAIPFAEDE